MNLKRQTGAILADVLCAAFILGVGLVSLAAWFVQAGRTGQCLNHEEQAILLAQDRMEQLHGLGSVDWKSATLHGLAVPDSVEKAGMRFDRSANVVQRKDLDPSGHLLEAEVSVSWDENGKLRRMSLLTYFAVETAIENLQ